jgi:DNA primase
MMKACWYNLSMSTIDEIKSKLDILDMVSETVQLRRSGKNYTGFCPFHSNTRTPAFVVFPESGTWRCFGQCNEGGDIFRFVMKKEGWDFTEALHYLAERAGVQLRASPQEA